MKPIPAPSNPEDSSIETPPSSASDLFKSSQPRNSQGNRRSGQANANQVYPWLLAASTAIAVFFGVMYINKPVVIASLDSEQPETPTDAAESGKETKDPALLPTGDSLPGETTGAGAGASSETPGALTTAPIHSRFEETNMRVQHILTATAEDGSISRIDLEVPVLYQSRNLRWTPAEVTRAQDLMVQLMEYQDKSRQLRSQGEKLLSDWNALIGKSIPASRLRADSPSIPENQKDIMSDATPSDTTTRDAVEIQPKDKP